MYLHQTTDDCMYTQCTLYHITLRFLNCFHESFFYSFPVVSFFTFVESFQCLTTQLYQIDCDKCIAFWVQLKDPMQWLKFLYVFQIRLDPKFLLHSKSHLLYRFLQHIFQLITLSDLMSLVCICILLLLLLLFKSVSIKVFFHLFLSLSFHLSIWLLLQK